MSAPSLSLDEFVCFAIYTANGAFNRAYKPALNAIGLTYPQYLAMVALWAKDGVTVGALGEQLFLESNTLTPLLKRLEAAGLVTRQRDAEDERQVRVHLTDEGRALRLKAASVPESIVGALGSAAAPEDIGRLRDEIARLRDALNAR
ncbi:MarR family winged helix-turn-helix transcriptional regulator [Methylopila turkensis]|uniref:MarR family transcriptional regulator n=1 Tax=Methylopila turkensis TaxID=1437816 RepID=A0A9W6N5P2_9HYPH|nr:MarR family transcriptional regulator [Methylopila turkensis]GLK78583.1 MarR family transcriptional regulator [Methylopila turkensis]